MIIQTTSPAPPTYEQSSTTTYTPAMYTQQPPMGTVMVQQPMGMQPMGMQPMGMQPMGMQPMGMQPMEMQQQQGGMQSLGGDGVQRV